MTEFNEKAEKLYHHYKHEKLPVPSLRKQLLENGYMETVYDEFRAELTTIKSSMVSSADEAQQCNDLIEKLLLQLKQAVEESV